MTGWSLDPELRTDMRLTRVRLLMERGEFFDAIIEAEELLDETPDHAATLRLLGEALLELGDAEGAVDAYEHHMTLVPDARPVLSALAVARFETCNLVGAVEAAREALRNEPENAEAHYYLGLSLERLGKMTDAVRHFIAARQLDPASYQLPLELDDETWRRCAAMALASLPQELSDFWSDIEIRFEGLPDLDELRRATPPITPTVYGLFFGRPEPDIPDQRPLALRFFRDNLARCADVEMVIEQMALTYEHEATAWMGEPLA